MNTQEAAKSLEKLGHPNRLEIVQLLVQAGPEGLPVGALQEHLGIPASTLSHHVSQLVSGGLIEQTRNGRVLSCTPNFERIHALVELLTENCCSGVAIKPKGEAA
ncbi:MAG: metalloregulator ArsR/SmtB family transcription factor [Pseudomonadota bacterium]